MKENKVKVLQFPIANSKGGITQYALQNWKYIDKSRFHFDFATISKSIDFELELKKTGAKLFYLSCSAEEDKEQFIEEFKSILIEGNYDVVHLHTGFWKSIIVEEIAKDVGIKKIIVHAHNSGVDILDNERREKAELNHFMIRDTINEEIATDYWACSLKAADFLFGDKISKDKIKIMSNAIDVVKFEFNKSLRNEIRSEMGIKENEYVIGNVGRFVYQKNQDFLLRVFQLLCEIRENCRLLLVGDGEKKQEYYNFVKENALEDKVIFTGFRKDVNKLMHVMDIFCLSSRFEGFPISLVEAQAQGLMCIVSNEITVEAKITDLVRYLPLLEDEWVEELINQYNVITPRLCLLKDTGYDIQKQIKILEELYENTEIEVNNKI